MGTLSRSVIALVTLVVAFAVVGGLAGCVEDGWYYVSGEPPIPAPPGGVSPECEIDVAPPSITGANDPRAPHALHALQSPTFATTSRPLGGPTAPAAAEPATFKTPTCVRNATD
jgi:hypothetical protein